MTETKVSAAKMAVQAEGLHKRFVTSEGEVHAVNDVSFTVEAGDFVALHGPSGCGKSTLLLMTGALLSPDGGRLEIAGEDPYQLKAEGRAAFRAAHVGFVFQQFHLIPYLDVLDNVLIGELAGERGSFDQRARELLEKFNIGHRLHHVPSKLSIGEQQRVALARALLRSPELLLADEPTGNLDPENSAIILQHLADYADDGGAVIMVTHDDRARAAAKSSLHLDAGQLIMASGEKGADQA
ncbi:MAG: ABC transporter ATP-binding protein [Verrucomicrobiales bacterium]|nr:ABC transporter ATP-binding protein [Verrucomicrobiales bacterium]